MHLKTFPQLRLRAHMHGCSFDVCVRRGGRRSGLAGQNIKTCACDGLIESGGLVGRVSVVVMRLGLMVL